MLSLVLYSQETYISHMQCKNITLNDVRHMYMYVCQLKTRGKGFVKETQTYRIQGESKQT